MTDRILNIKQAAEMLSLSENTLRWMRHNGTGPKSFKLGKRISYRESDLDAYVEEQIAHEDRRLAEIKEARNA